MMTPEHKRVTGLSGNEIFCLSKVDMRAGQLCVGNSVVSIGVAGGIGAGLSALGGGEVNEVTRLVHDGRQKSFDRMLLEARHYGGTGIMLVSNLFISFSETSPIQSDSAEIYRELSEVSFAAK